MLGLMQETPLLVGNLLDSHDNSRIRNGWRRQDGVE